MLEKKCQFCENIFSDLFKSWLDRRSYCSKSCSMVGKSTWNKGLKTGLSSEKQRALARNRWMGENNPNYGKDMSGGKNGMWKGGVSKKHSRLRGKPEWSDWRKSVFERDDYKCLDCGLGGSNLEPHHIIPLRVDLSKAYKINNGITLCRPCHQKTFWKEEQLVNTYQMFVARQV